MLAQVQHGYADYIDSLPDLAARKAPGRIVIAAIAGDYCNFVTFGSELNSKI
jgi:hypothetical protein